MLVNTNRSCSLCIHVSSQSIN